MEKRCGFLLQSDPSAGSSTDVRTLLGASDTTSKIEGMKALIHSHLRGEPQPSMLMSVIQNVVPHQDHALKKLVLLYWELVDKRGADGKLLPEMILVCNFIRNDLNHSNEYARGVTLRFLSKMMESDLLEPLIPSVLVNLDHPLEYVRKNALLVVFNVYRHFEALIPDAPQLVEAFLEQEASRGGSNACVRNAFLMLSHCAPASAVRYMMAHLDASLDETLQMLMLDLIRREARADPDHKGRYIKPLIVLLDSKSAAVQFDGAATLLSLSSSSSAVRQAAQTYISLLVDQSDNNVKLIVLDRLTTLCRRHVQLLQEMAMDVLRALASPSLDIRGKTLALAETLVTSRNVEEVMLVLRKEVVRTEAEPDGDRTGEYRQALVATIHRCCLRFPDVAGSVVHVLLDLIGDRNTTAAVDVASFVREIAESYPSLRKSIVKKLLQSVPIIRSSRVFRAALWVVGEYVEADETEILYAMSTFHNAVGGPLPRGPSSGDGDGASAAAAAAGGQGGKDGGADGAAQSADGASKPKAGPKILADGSYATEVSAADPASSSPSSAEDSGPVSSMRQLLLAGDFFLASALCTALAKLCLKLRAVSSEAIANKRCAETLRFFCQLLRFGRCGASAQRMEDDSRERIAACIRVLSDSSSSTAEMFLRGGRETFASMLAEQKAKLSASGAASAPGSLRKQQGQQLGSGQSSSSQSSSQSSKGGPGAAADKSAPAAAAAAGIHPDDLISIRQLKPRSNPAEAIFDDDDAILSLGADGENEKEDLASRLSRVSPLTGYSDPVYAEACVTVHAMACDIVLDILLINQTAETLQNLSLELATVGELRLCERPGLMVLAPGASRRLTVNLKVSSTESGVVYGTIVYDAPGAAAGAAAARKCINLNDVHVDIMSLIHANECTDTQFRAMWSEFEWENKVAINTSITDVKEYTRHIIRETNMCCLNEQATFSGSTEFLSANLVAKSIFGEDALINVSVEREPEGKLVGTCRIRAKQQGLALSLGDRITLKQKGRESARD